MVPCLVRIQHRFEIGDNLLWLRLLELHALEVRRRDLERVEQEAGSFLLESLLQHHLHDLANDGLNGVRVFKKRQGDFAGRVLSVGAAREGTGTVVLVIETEKLVSGRGRSTVVLGNL